MRRFKLMTLEGCEEIERIALHRATLPTDVELAHKHRVSRRRIQQIMKDARDVMFRNPVIDHRNEKIIELSTQSRIES